MFARVVIDLKTQQLDQLFDYLIPTELEDLVQVGSRVVVSFGTMERVGYVIEITESSQMASKPILELLDPTPILDDELLEIYHYLLEHSTSLKSQILEAIIPSEFMMEYQKEVTLLNKFDDDLIKNFNKEGKWILKKSDNNSYRKLKELEQKGFVKIKTVLKPRVKPKEVIAYQFNYNHNYQRINRYPEVLDLFREKDLILRKDLLEELSVSAINTLEKNEVLIRTSTIIKRDIIHTFDKKEYDITLNKEQNQALNQIIDGLNSSKEYLLFGVTGSGKTEVYVNVVSEVIKKGKKALILVPEINMISQVARRLKSSFNNVAIIHSSLSPGEKYDQYQMIYSEEANIILGTRSSVFAPIDNLGIIIIDEEQDESYIQSEQAIYDAIKIAKIRQKFHNCPIVYTSATPKVETMYQALNGEIKLLTLTKKAVETKRASLEFVNLKDELESGHTSIISRPLIEAITSNLINKEQSIILVNRKGYATFVMCRVCGHIPKCPTCDVSLTYYLESDELKCHYCGYKKPYTTTCSNCSSNAYSQRGIGIEQVIYELKKFFPKAKIIQMDQTTTRLKGMQEKMWYQFLKSDGDILIGTQMVAKGFDFPDVTLSAVIMADQDLKLSSYNADEKTYILLEQLIGRSGRHKPGRAIIQGYDLDHFAIRALNFDYMTFYNQALQNRKVGNYPPFVKMSQLIIMGPSILTTYQQAYLVKEKIENINLTTLGPVESFIFKKGDYYRFKLTIKHQDNDVENIINIAKTFQKDGIRITYTPFLDLE